MLVRTGLALLVGFALAAAAPAAAPLAPPGRTADVIDEQSAVAWQGGQVDFVTQPTLVTDANRAGLLYAVPAPSYAGAATLRLAEVRALTNQVVWHRVFRAGTVRTWLAWWRGRNHPQALPDQPVAGEVKPAKVAVTPAAELGPDRLDAWLRAQGLALPAGGAVWLADARRAGRQLVAVVLDLPGRAGELRAAVVPPLELRYTSAEGFIPFSQPQAADPRAGATDRPYFLAILAADRQQPVWPDGTAPFPDLALQCAWRVPPARRTDAWLAGAPPYLTCYQANVPRTARQFDLQLKPDPGPEVTPTRKIDRLRYVPVPIDALAVLALLALAAAVISARRRRGRTSSASAPGRPAA